MANINTPPGPAGLDTWFSDAEVEELRQRLLASAPDLPDDSPVYIRGTFNLTFEEKGKNVSEREVTHSNVFALGELSGTAYVDPRTGKEVFWDHFRKAIANLLTSNMRANWKAKSPKARILESMQIVTVRRPDTKKRLDKRDTEFETGMAELAARSHKSVTVGKVYTKRNKRYVDIMDSKGRLLVSVPWKPTLVRIVKGLFPEVQKTSLLPIDVKRPKRKRVKAPPRVRPMAQTRSGERLFETRVRRVEIGSRYKMRNHYYVKIRDRQGRSYTLRWYPGIRKALGGFGLEF